MKKFRSIICSLLTLVIIAGAVCMMTPPSALKVQAAGSRAGASVKTLAENKTYKSFDITGNGKADSLKVSVKEKDGKVIYKLLVNGNKKYTCSADPIMEEAEFKALTLKNGRTYIYIGIYGWDDQGVFGIYGMKNGKFCRLADLNHVRGLDGYGYSLTADVKAVNDNDITITYFQNSYLTGLISYDYVYTFKDGGLKLASSNAKVIGVNNIRTGLRGRSLTASRKIVMYKTAGSDEKVSAIKAGQKVTFLYVKGTKTGTWYKVKADGITGWIKAIDEMPETENYWFKDLEYTI